jgi:hypothetical protein
LQLTPSLAQKSLIDTTTGEYTAYGLAISLIASAEVSEIHCGLKGQIAAALNKAGRLGTPIDLDDKENYSAVVFMASQMMGNIKKAGVAAWCKDKAPNLVRFLQTPSTVEAMSQQTSQTLDYYIDQMAANELKLTKSEGERESVAVKFKSLKALVRTNPQEARREIVRMMAENMMAVAVVRSFEPNLPEGSKHYEKYLQHKDDFFRHADSRAYSLPYMDEADRNALLAKMDRLRRTKEGLMFWNSYSLARTHLDFPDYPVPNKMPSAK